MQAWLYEQYGTPEVLQLREVEAPPLADDGVLVRVRAASVNPVDWHMLIGTPYLVRTMAGLRKPKTGLIGSDFTGTVEAVGKDVTGLAAGDEVFGARTGSLAEYVCARKAVVRRPTGLGVEEAASVGVAAVTALQGLRDKGRITAGQHVLINGASGGVGTFAVQIAKSFGAEVTGVCSTRNVEQTRALGADHVIDYTREDFTHTGRRYDLMLDVAGNRSWAECKRVLTKNAIVVAVGGPKTNRWVGPMALWVGRRLLAVPGGRKVATPFIAKLNKDDLAVLAALMAEGKVKPVVERRYAWEEAPEALRYLGEGHARGKLVVAVG